MIFFELTTVFAIGAVGGWVLELFFRRFFSMKKWINPGFLNGPYLPMYGFGAALLYGACFIPLPRWALVLLLTAALTALEYVTGLIFIKGMKIKLWDYSDRFGNVQGIICPLFSLLWGLIAAGFVYLLFPPLQTAAVWAGGSAWALFAEGAFYGALLVDVCISFNVSLRVRKAAAQIREAVHYERLKAALNDLRAERRQKRRFLFPFAGGSLLDAVQRLHARNMERLRALRGPARRKQDKKDGEDGGEKKDG